jgi:integrase
MVRNRLSKPQADLVTDLAATVTIHDTIRDFISDYRAKDAADQTRYRYAHYMEDFAAWLEREGHPVDMASLQGKRGFRYVQSYLAYLRSGRAAAPGTVATAFRVIKTFWNWAVRESLDEDGEPGNPPYVRKAPTDFFTKSDRPKDVVADDIGEPFTDDEVKRILDAIGPPNSRRLEVLRNRAIVHTLLSSGVRRCELTRLLMSDFNPDTGVILVRRSTAKRTRRDDDARLTTLYGEAWREVNRYVRRLRAERLGSGPMFPSMRGAREYRGRPMRPDSITQLLQRIVESIQEACPNRACHAKGEGCSECVRYGGVHRFRATWACNQLRRGAAPSAVKEAGGWSSYEMVDRYSRKVRGEVALEEIRRVNRLGVSGRR